MAFIGANLIRGIHSIERVDCPVRAGDVDNSVGDGWAREDRAELEETIHSDNRRVERVVRLTICTERAINCGRI